MLVYPFEVAHAVMISRIPSDGSSLDVQFVGDPASRSMRPTVAWSVPGAACRAGHRPRNGGAHASGRGVPDELDIERRAVGRNSGNHYRVGYFKRVNQHYPSILRHAKCAAQDRIPHRMR